MAGLSASVENDTDAKALDVAADTSSGPDTSDGGVAVAGHVAEAEDLVPNHIYGSREVTLNVGNHSLLLLRPVSVGARCWGVWVQSRMWILFESGASRLSLYR